MSRRVDDPTPRPVILRQDQTHFRQDRTRILTGDVLKCLRTLGAESVQSCITSPPYWGLRNYGHEGQIGLEKSVDEYVAKMVEVFREVRRVLHPTGVVWLNLGDSFASAWACDRRSVIGNGSPDKNCKRPNRLSSALKEKDLVGVPWRVAFALQADGWYLRSCVIWSKGNPMPESVAGWRWARCRVKVGSRPGVGKQITNAGSLTAQTGGVDVIEWADCPGCKKCIPNDGWVLRKGSWRPTQAHEYLFLLAKSADYYGDGEAVKEAMAATSVTRMLQPSFDGQGGGPKDPLNGGEGSANRSARKALENLAAGIRPKQDRAGRRTYEGFNLRWDTAEENGDTPASRNLRSVWNVNTQPYSEAHFAVWPEKLVKPMVLSSTPEAGVCSECGTPWAQVVTRTKDRDTLSKGSRFDAGKTGINGNGRVQSGERYTKEQGGWRPSCRCDAPARPAVVLDCFAGSGTTGVVALQYGQHFIGIELSPEYVELANKRLAPVVAQGSLL